MSGAEVTNLMIFHVDTFIELYDVPDAQHGVMGLNITGFLLLTSYVLSVLFSTESPALGRAFST